MRLIRRYLTREIVSATLLVLAALIALFAFFDLLRELENVGQGQYRLPVAVTYVLLSVPGHIYEILPVAVLVGTLFVLARMTAQSEYAILRTSGISMLRLAGTLAQIGLVFALATFVIGEWIAPASEAAAKRLRVKAATSVIVSQFRSGVWVKDGDSFINVVQVTPENTLLNVYIYDFDERKRLRSVSFAREGHFEAGKRWRLEDVVRTSFDGERSEVSRMAALEWNSVLTPSLLSVLLLKPEEMSVTNLYEYIDHLKSTRQQSTRFEIAFWSKLIYPLSVVLLMVLALPFAHFSSRVSGVGSKIFMGILLGLAFHLLGRLFSALGTLNNWSPVTSAAVPTMVFLVIAAAMIWRAERR